MCMCAIVLIICTKFVNKEEIVSGTRSEDSVTLRLSSLRVFTMKIHSKLCFNVFVFLFVKKLQSSFQHTSCFGYNSVLC